MKNELKNICQVELTRYRSISGFLLNIVYAIAAYSFFSKKPSIKANIKETDPKTIPENKMPQPGKLVDVLIVSRIIECSFRGIKMLTARIF